VPHRPRTFIPLFIIWLGIGEMPKEVLIMIGVAPIMAVTTAAALDEISDDLRLCARTLTGRWAYLSAHALATWCGACAQPVE
jgi:ABC-type nitrate/sulfonate/bicarbonate transport system permease component